MSHRSVQALCVHSQFGKHDVGRCPTTLVPRHPSIKRTKDSFAFPRYGTEGNHFEFVSRCLLIRRSPEMTHDSSPAGSTPSRNSRIRRFNPFVARTVQEPYTDTTEPQGKQPLRIEVTGACFNLRCSTLCKFLLVLRAHNVPHIKTLGVTKEYFVTISSGVPTKKTMKKTKSVQMIEGQTVVWDQALDPLYDPLLSVVCCLLTIPFSFVQPSSYLILCLHAKRLARKDFLIGAQEIMIPAESERGSFAHSYPSYD